jgi:tripartite-type tricarboxylate transporter receptor subunit TctC
MLAIVRVVLVSIVLMPVAPLHAQDYPNRPVRIIDPFSPGGSTDILARICAQKLTERLGKPFLVENRGGGGGNIGAEAVARAAPDGHMLLVAGVPQAIGMTLYRKLNYDLAKDLAPITQLATFPSLISVHPSLPVKNMKELIALARARPGELNFGANPGSPNQLAIELVDAMAKVKMNFIGYKGAGPAVADTVAGQIQVVSAGLPTLIGYVKAGRLRPIAVTSQTRSALLPEVPTASESGLPGYNVTSWYGLFAPSGTPAPIIDKLNAEVAALLKAPDVDKRLAAMGAEAAPTTPEEFGRIVRSEIARWAPVVKASGASVN